MEETPERHISKYAAPALGICTTIPEEQKSELLKIIDNGGSFTRKQIQDFFPKACEIMEIIAEEKGLEDIWHLEVSKKYWLEDHNYHAMHDECKVIEIKYQGQEIPPYLKSELQEGDRVTTHLGTIIEKLQ